MTHRSAPLAPEGRKRLVERCRTRPIAHVAAEMGVSRTTASKWVNRYKQFGELGLVDRSSARALQPTATPGRLVEQIESMRREVRRIVAIHPGHMVHLELKKAGRIPDGGGWRAHGRDSAEARAVARTKERGMRTRYVYLHSAIDGHTRLAYTEALENEQAATAVAFLGRAREWFAKHGITKIERIITDNGACYRAHAFAAALDGAAHRRTRPYTPKHNGKVERSNRILDEEFLYARTWRSETERGNALTIWNLHYNYHRPHGAHGGKPPAAATPLRVNNVLASYNYPSATYPH